MDRELDLPAIATFCAFGFFLDDDTYYKSEKFKLDKSSSSIQWLDAFSRYDWHYHPRNISLNTATDEFAKLFEEIIDGQTGQQQVILPLSGGLDSRTQAAALKRLGKKVHAFSYRFKGGIDESAFARQIAKACSFPLEVWEITEGYLWNKIGKLASLNHCYTDFTHPRQMAFAGKYANLGEIFSLGHWGDVLFDTPGVPENLPVNAQVEAILKKFIKRGGQALAEDMWKSWGLHGSWMDYIRDRIFQLLVRIPIESNANARIRAFKSRYWATRWTAANFTIFEYERPVTAPYFDTRMCDFICSLPEELLADRKIQIEYLKKYFPELARITWQEHKPFNLFNYQLDRSPLNLPYRAVNKIMREFRSIAGTKHILRNWELQFIGNKNDAQLRDNLSGLGASESFIPKPVMVKYYNAFKNGEQLLHAHPLSMLLTLSVFASQQKA